MSEANKTPDDDRTNIIFEFKCFEIFVLYQNPLLSFFSSFDTSISSTYL